VRCLAALVLALALAGCGLAVGSAPSAVELLVTREFGQRVLARASGLHAGQGETVLSLLAGHTAVQAGSKGGSVASIDALPAGTQIPAGGQNTRWVYYVNGVQASKRPGAASVHPGDHVWWDLHDTSQAPAMPAAVVGAFPQPFLNGIEGKRLPVRVECTTVSGYACAVSTCPRRSPPWAAVARRKRCA
jgi:hypothetical protein